MSEDEFNQIFLEEINKISKTEIKLKLKTIENKLIDSMDNETLEDLRKAKKTQYFLDKFNFIFLQKNINCACYCGKLISKSFERLVDKGVSRGFITHDELQKSLGKRNSNIESLERAILHIFDLAVTLVKQKSDFKIKEKEQDNAKTSKSPERSDDPIRMYLREMGSRVAFKRG